MLLHLATQTVFPSKHLMENAPDIRVYIRYLVEMEDASMTEISFAIGISSAFFYLDCVLHPCVAEFKSSVREILPS